MKSQKKVQTHRRIFIIINNMIKEKERTQLLIPMKTLHFAFATPFESGKATNYIGYHCIRLQHIQTAIFFSPSTPSVITVVNVYTLLNLSIEFPLVHATISAQFFFPTISIVVSTVVPTFLIFVLTCISNRQKIVCIRQYFNIVGCCSGACHQHIISYQS